MSRAAAFTRKAAARDLRGAVCGLRGAVCGAACAARCGLRRGARNSVGDAQQYLSLREQTLNWRRVPFAERPSVSGNGFPRHQA